MLHVFANYHDLRSSDELLNTCFSSSPVSFHAAEANWFFSLRIKSLHSSKGHYKNKIQGVIHQYCSGIENLRELPGGEVYDILMIKTDKKVEVTKLISTIWQVQHAKSPLPPIWHNLDPFIYELHEQLLNIY